MSQPKQGEIWWAEEPDLGRRPVLVVTRSWATPVLHAVVVAPVTRRVRSIPTEVPLGPADGLGAECAAAFDNLRTVRRSLLTRQAGTLAPARRGEICAALAALADCP